MAARGYCGPTALSRGNWGQELGSEHTQVPPVTPTVVPARQGTPKVEGPTGTPARQEIHPLGPSAHPWFLEGSLKRSQQKKCNRKDRTKLFKFHHFPSEFFRFWCLVVVFFFFFFFPLSTKRNIEGGTASQRDRRCPCSTSSPTMPAEDSSQPQPGQGPLGKKGQRRHGPVLPWAHTYQQCLEQADGSTVLTSTISGRWKSPAWSDTAKDTVLPSPLPTICSDPKPASTN